jgi:predicted permease
VLLVGAVLLLRSFSALSRVDTGIDTHNLLTFQLNLTGTRGQDAAARVAFYQAALRAIEAVPGVKSAGAAVTLPIGGDDFGAGVIVDGVPPPPAGQEPRVGFQVVAPGYFRTMRIPLRDGRDFSDSDTPAGAPVVLVNDTFARQHWPGTTAVGRRVKLGGEGADWETVIGVVGDVRHLGPATPPRPEIYKPVAQQSFSFMAFVVRTHAEPHAVVPSIRDAMATLDPTLPLASVSTMDEHITRALSRPRFMSALVAAFGALALLLAIVGIYGMMAWSVAQRTRELAIRSALGARRSEVLVMVLRRAALLGVTGVAAGLAAALPLSRGLTGMLFGVSPTNPATYATVSVLLVAVAVLAGVIPAVRATRVDSATLLR